MLVSTGVTRSARKLMVCALPLVVIALLGGARIARAEISFQDVTATAGPFHMGETWGAA